MPGLAAIISHASRQRHEHDIHAMIRSMQHESFYTTGTYSDETAGLYVGWTCQPGSYCDCLPIANDKGDLVLFFYGEHHATEDEDNRWQARGHASLKPDASLLVHLFEEHGHGLLKQLNGWFHGILLDKTQRKIAVFNDRYGMQRLYHYSDRDSVAFASEAKALLKVRPELRSMDPDGVGELLSCGAVLENRTLFSKLETLPAASLWSFENARLQNSQRYFRPEDWETQPPLPEHELEERLEALMPRLATRYARSQLPVAVSLTGGYDTRLIMAFLGRQWANGLCYTFGGISRDCFDVRIARKVAAACGSRHEVLRLDDEFFYRFPALAEKTVYISDGNLGACNAYELYLNTRARQIAPLKITGSFGSEVMRGARAFKASRPSPGLLQPQFQKHVDSAAETFARTSQGHDLSFSVFKHAPWYYYNRLAVEQSQLIVRTPFMDNELVGLMYRAHRNGVDHRELAFRLIRYANPTLARLPTDTGNTSWWKYQLLRFLFQADYCYKSGMPQWLEQIHYLLGPLQPERFFIGLHRFQHPRVWFRKQLADYVKNIVLDPKTATRPYFNQAFLETMVRRHLKGDRNYTDDIERVLTIELTHRLLVDAC